MESSDDMIVVGSGPAGVACAYALLKKGHSVLMLDVGRDLEPGVQARVERMRSSEPESWSASDVETLRSGLNPNTTGVPMKLVYGSEYPYRALPEFCRIQPSSDVDIKASYARGGLSTAWGGAILPYIEQDLKDWPIGVNDLAPHYNAVLDLLPVTGSVGGVETLSSVFPAHTEKFTTLKQSRQAEKLGSNLMRSRERLRRDGIVFGQARVGVWPKTQYAQDGCKYCGLCLYGCPYGLIYSAADSVAKLSREFKSFSYLPHIFVDELCEESSGQVRVKIVLLEKTKNAQSAQSVKTETIVGSRIFLASGIFNTARILLKSEKRFGQRVAIKYSEYFMFPMLQFRGARDVEHEKLQTLAQFYLEILDPKISPYSIHLQIYTYADLYLRTFEHMFGSFFFLVRPGIRWLLSRFLIVQGYLHSAESSSMSMALKSGQHQVLEVRKIPGGRAKKLVTKLIAKLWRHAWSLGAVPLGVMKSIGPTGKGFHSGGTFPMRGDSAPGASDVTPLTTDVLGRLRRTEQGRSRIHLVDASVFPSIPASTITFTIMANAHRIGSAAADLK